MSVAIMASTVSSRWVSSRGADGRDLPDAAWRRPARVLDEEGQCQGAENIRRASADQLGATDLAKVDAHTITAEAYDEIPELTDATMARAVSGDGLTLLERGQDRSISDQPKRQITLRLDADVIAATHASGPGWQIRANEALKNRLKR